MALITVTTTHSVVQSDAVDQSNIFYQQPELEAYFNARYFETAQNRIPTVKLKVLFRNFQFHRRDPTQKVIEGDHVKSYAVYWQYMPWVMTSSDDFLSHLKIPPVMSGSSSG